VPPLLAQKTLSDTDIGELHRLIQPHLIFTVPVDKPPSDSFDVTIRLNQIENPVIFSIPGYQSLGCAKCHEGKSLHFKAAERMRRALAKLKTINPELRKIPLRQYIIQSWSDRLLTSNQLAHTTFDTIRISPAAILIDTKAYHEATHLHESLHLVQSFVGPVNELEAYSLNIISDPRFLLLKFPYYEDTIKTFFIKDFSEVLNEFYARPIREKLIVPQETQWFLASFSEGKLERLRQVIKKIIPLLNDVTQLNRNYSKEFAFLSEQAGNPALLLEIVAAKHLPIPDSEVTKETRRKAFNFFDLQMNKKDNIQLGYKVNRKKEAFLFIQSKLMIKDPTTLLRLYFEYIKKSFIKSDGMIKIPILNKKNLDSYIQSKVEGIRNMISYKEMSKIERESAGKLIENILAPEKKNTPNP